MVTAESRMRAPTDELTRRISKMGMRPGPKSRRIRNCEMTYFSESERAARMGREAWRRARMVFGEERCSNEYDALYGRLVSRRR